MTILWHKHKGLPHHQIAELSDAAPDTVTATIRRYTDKGLKGVGERNFNCPTSQTVVNDSYINALSVYDLLQKLAVKHAGEAVTLFLDNARYQKCKIGTELAEQLKIELIHLPAYSPNLNLIERLWRYVIAPR
jgi:DDE superfamily endonuclease